MGKFTLLLVALIYVILTPALAFAESYDVTATVHAPMPEVIPVITNPVDLVQESSRVFISGTCAIVDPPLIVLLIRDNVVIGSGPCLPDGSFKIYVGLVNGKNVIYPKFINITGLFGELGVPITIEYYPISTSYQEESGSGEALTIVFDYDFVEYNDTDLTEVVYAITGGKPPYKVTVSWGDDTLNKYLIESPGEQSIQHQYESVLPPSQLTIQVTDSVGQKTSQSRALISFKKGVFIPATIKTESPNRWMLIVTATTAILAGIFVLIEKHANGSLVIKKSKKGIKILQPKLHKK